MKILEGLNASVKILKNYVDKQIAEKVQQTTKEFNEKLDKTNENIQQTDIKIQQSDWNQNDESSIDHVKNRTHYDDVEYTSIMGIPIVNKDQWIDGASDLFNLKNGDVVKVKLAFSSGTMPSQEYVCKVVKKQIGAAYNPWVFYIGNGYKYYSENNYRSYLEDTGEPFCITMSTTSNQLYLSLNDAGNNGVCIIYKGVEVTHQLPQKYIQDSLDKYAMDTMPDWNQYDEKSLDYVKNRTHYTEPAFTQIVVESTFTNRLSFDLFSYPYTGVEGKQAIIVFDGVEYKQSFRATLIHDKTYSPIVYHLGNIALDPAYNTSAYAVDTGEPFYIHAVGYAIAKDATTEHTITISVQDGETVHQLPKKYIPDDVKQPDWNQNDNTKSGYIKNRPFYEEDVYELIGSETVTADIPMPGGLPYTESIPPTNPLEIFPIEGQEYIVTFNGIEYKCVVAVDSDVGPYIGNLYLMPSKLDSTLILAGEPFIFVEGCMRFFRESGTHEFSISVKKTVIHTIEPKYLPAPIYINGKIEVSTGETITLERAREIVNAFLSGTPVFYKNDAKYIHNYSLVSDVREYEGPDNIAVYVAGVIFSNMNAYTYWYEIC